MKDFCEDDLKDVIDNPTWHMGPCQGCAKYYATRYCVPCYKEICELCDAEKICCVSREKQKKLQEEKKREQRRESIRRAVMCVKCRRAQTCAFYKCYTCEYKVCAFCMKIKDFDDYLPQCRKCYKIEKEEEREERQMLQLLSFFNFFE